MSPDLAIELITWTISALVTGAFIGLGIALYATALAAEDRDLTNPDLKLDGDAS